MYSSEHKVDAITAIQRFWRRRPFITPVYSNQLMNLINMEDVRNMLARTFIGLRGEMMKDKSSNLVLPSDLSEYIIEKSLAGGKGVGMGNASVDVSNDNICIDVACVCLNQSNITNEKSLMQNFKRCGQQLDMYFKESTYQSARAALQLYVRDIQIKYETLKTQTKYYLIFISTKSEIYLTAWKINPSQLQHVRSRGFTGLYSGHSIPPLPNTIVESSVETLCLNHSTSQFTRPFLANLCKKRGLPSSGNIRQLYTKLKSRAPSVEKLTPKSIRTEGFINDRFGQVKLYKAKKRLELRLNFEELGKIRTLVYTKQ